MLLTAPTPEVPSIPCGSDTYHIDACLSAIKANTLYRRTPLLAYLAYLELREMVASSSLLAHEHDQGYYLVHPDSTSDNVLIAENGEVTGLLDWEW